MSRISSSLILIVAVLFVLIGQKAVAEPSEPSAKKKKHSTREELTKKFDKNSDGKLSLEERKTMRKAIIEGRVDVPPKVREYFRRLAQSPRPNGPWVPQNVTIQRDVVYGNAGNRPLVLDMITPKRSKQKAESPLPLIVFIHGGGWRAGNKASGISRLVPYVATGNYVGATVGYRLTGEAIWPAQIHDCKAAIRWLRVNAEKYQIDPERIGVWGTSAGGHLVNMLGTSGDVETLEGQCGSPDESSRVSCVVPFCGPTNFLAPKRFEGGRSPSAVNLLLGGKILEKQELAAEASPITHVTKDDPPFLIVHGTSDGTVPFEQAEIFHEALKKAHVDVTFIKMLGGGHGIRGDAINARVKTFFEKHLRKQDVEISAEPIEVSRPK